KSLLELQSHRSVFPLRFPASSPSRFLQQLNLTATLLLRQPDSILQKEKGSTHVVDLSWLSKIRLIHCRRPFHNPLFQSANISHSFPLRFAKMAALRANTTLF